MEAILLEYHYVSGEESHTSKKLLKLEKGETPDQATHRWLHDMWGAETIQRDGMYWNPTETVYIKVIGWSEVKPEDVGVLRRYGI